MQFVDAAAEDRHQRGKVIDTLTLPSLKTQGFLVQWDHLN